MVTNAFGGSWTERKLGALEKYLKAYLTIFTRNPKAARFTRHYIDAFAGSGVREAARLRDDIFANGSGELADAVTYMDGSVKRVLGLQDEFHQYWFVERNRQLADELRNTIDTEFPDRAPACNIHVGDANEFLLHWASTATPMDRAVVFLDPYGMSVKWTTLETLAATKKVDLWMLFPSSSVIRMLPNSGPPDEAWSRKLTDFFGTEDWREFFYRPGRMRDMFEEEDASERVVNEATVAEFLKVRLKEIFTGVVDHPLTLRASRGPALYMLVFAVSNPNGKKAALNIADYIIGSM